MSLRGLGSLAVPNQFGLPPANAQVEDTWAVGMDALIIDPATALSSSYEFYDATTSKPSQYRTSVLSVIAQQRAITITSLRLSHNLAFAAFESEPVGSQLETFNKYSYIQITTLQKKHDRLFLCDLVEQQLVNIQGTVTGFQKFAPILRLPQPIYVPKGGDIQITFYPLQGYTTAAAGATNPHLPGGGTASERAFNVTLTYFGGQQRPMS